MIKEYVRRNKETLDRLLTNKKIRKGVPYLAAIAFGGTLGFSTNPNNSAVIPKNLNKWANERTVSPNTVMAFFNRYEKAVVNLRANTTLVKDLGTQGCKLHQDKANESSTLPYVSNQIAIEAKDKTGGYEFFAGPVVPSHPSVKWLVASKINLSGCNDGETADGGIGLIGDKREWSVVVDYSNFNNGQGMAYNLSTSPSSNTQPQEGPLTQHDLKVITKYAYSMLDEASKQANVPEITSVPYLGTQGRSSQ